MARATQQVSEPAEINFARRLASRHDLRPPVDVLALARFYAEVAIENIPFDIDGVCYDLKLSGRRPKIVLNKGRPERRLRFTAAHELGHVIIPWHIGTKVDNAESMNDDDAVSTMEAEANRFASEILLPSSWMCLQLSEMTNPISTLSKLSNIANTSTISTAWKIISHLPPGYIFAHLSNSGQIDSAGKSKGTHATLPPRGALLASWDGYRTSEETWDGKLDGGTFIFWRMASRIDLGHSEETRPWRAILEHILSELTAIEQERQAVWKSIAGIVGAAKGRRKYQSPEEVHAYLLIRFHDRGENSILLSAVARHPEFSVFLTQRVRDLNLTSE